MDRKERMIWIMLIFIVFASTVPINLGRGGLTLFDHVFYALLRGFRGLH